MTKLDAYTLTQQNVLNSLKLIQMLTLEELHKILKSRPFKSEVINSTDSYIFNFTEVFVFRDESKLCLYELVQDKNNFKFIFGPLYQDVYTGNFKNVTLVIPGDNRFPIIINSDNSAIPAFKTFDITLIGQ